MQIGIRSGRADADIGVRRRAVDAVDGAEHETIARGNFGVGPNGRRVGDAGRAVTRIAEQRNVALGRDAIARVATEETIVSSERIARAGDISDEGVAQSARRELTGPGAEEGIEAAGRLVAGIDAEVGVLGSRAVCETGPRTEEGVVAGVIGLARLIAEEGIVAAVRGAKAGMPAKEVVGVSVERIESGSLPDKVVVAAGIVKSARALADKNIQLAARIGGTGVQAEEAVR